MRQWFSKLMYGRYGGDALGRFLSFAAIVPLVVSMIVGGAVGAVLWALTLALMVWMYVRMASRNISARSRENQKYLALRSRFLGALRGARNRFRQRREYRFFRCPKCRAWLRVPRGRGKLRVNCRQCGTGFDAKS